ncbi:MAG: tetratricopeptide repeat protein [Streptosporangiales bacterium]|nr:tetratricopeptide repeat protein [Streptosporangiales bacterium]
MGVLEELTVRPDEAARVRTHIRPRLPDVWVDRPALIGRLAGATGRRLTTVVAGAGFGKTALLTAWAERVDSVWYPLSREDAALPALSRGLYDALRARRPGLAEHVVDSFPGAADAGDPGPADGIAAAIGEALARECRDDLVLILDDVQELAAGSPAARLVEGLCRHAPPSLHVVLSSRDEPPFPIERLRGRGQVLELDGAALAFTEAETRTLLDALLGAEDGAGGCGSGNLPVLAARLHDITEGWPAATVLAAEWLRHRPASTRTDALLTLGRPGGPLFVYLAEEAFARETPETHELVRRMAALPRFTAGLCDALGLWVDEEQLARLARCGLLRPCPGRAGWFTTGPLVRDFATAPSPLGSPLDPRDRRALQERAAAWYTAEGHIKEALSLLCTLGDPSAVGAFLERHGSAMLARGAAGAVVSAAARLRGDLRTAAVELVEGEARQLQGDWYGALRCLRRAAGPSGRLDPGLAWRIGLVHHVLGEHAAAMEAYESADVGDTVADMTADGVLVLAWRAGGHWVRGEAEEGRRSAARALAAAQKCGDARALAAAHTAMALLAAHEGDGAGCDTHYARALEAALRTKDVFQVICVRANRAARSTEEGAYRRALAELAELIQDAELAGFTGMAGFALCNRGTAHLALGEFDEATADFEAAKAGYQRIGSSLVARPLTGLGDVYRQRGDLALARAAYEEAIEVAERSGDRQTLGPALAGLARVRLSDDSEGAAALAERALAESTGTGKVRGLLAAGWVSLARGQRKKAAELAATATAVAGSRRDRTGLAEALELQALSAPGGTDRLRLLQEAESVWRAVENPVGAARAALAAARVSAAPSSVLEAGMRRLRELGVRPQAETAAGPLRCIAVPGHARVQVHVLGGFQVLRDGRPAGADEWRSKKARDLFKMLLGRRGRPTPRELLMDTLWPDEDPVRCANRLSVALSTIRGVLDPEREFAADYFVAADRYVIGIANLRVDVEEFLAAVRTGMARYGRGEPGALSALREAEAAYTGDFLEEDPYEDWAVPLREEAKAAYLEATRTLAGAAAESGEYDQAVRYWLRVLERDCYDEEAHLALVTLLAAAGRHGEARRRYRLYVERMDEIGVEPAPFPSH